MITAISPKWINPTPFQSTMFLQRTPKRTRLVFGWLICCLYSCLWVYSLLWQDYWFYFQWVPLHHRIFFIAIWAFLCHKFFITPPPPRVSLKQKQLLKRILLQLKCQLTNFVKYSPQSEGCIWLVYLLEAWFPFLCILVSVIWELIWPVFESICNDYDTYMIMRKMVSASQLFLRTRMQMYYLIERARKIHILYKPTKLQTRRRHHASLLFVTCF